jgi:ribosome maturation factor RimP
MKAPDLNALDQLIRPAVEGQDYELIELDWTRQLGKNVLRVTIDRPPGQGFVSHEDCVRVSREVSALLDVHDQLIQGVYSLEVSSPGVDRPLKKSADFERLVGQKARVRLRAESPRSFATQDLSPDPKTGEPGKPRRNFVGTIESVAGDVVRLSVEGAGVFELYIPEMEKANLVYEFS